MGIFDRISRVVRANVNDMIDKAEDPEKVLEQSLREMGDDLVKMRQAVAQAIAAQKRTEQQYQKNVSEANMWQQRAQLALTKGEETLAREALVRKKTHADTAATLKAQLDGQVGQIDALRRNLTGLESKISEAKTKKDMLKARMSAAKANQQLQSTISSLNTNSAMAAFERMEDKVVQMEAISGAEGELAGIGGDSKWAALEGGSEVEDELAMMKAQLSGIPLSGTPQPTTALPQGMDNPTSATSSPASSGAFMDDELEKLREQLRKS
ncbi:MAG: PspA/IM30 family protein [Cyanobacteria bacterium]|uniref:PspA/IM30 family protein n=1 Tax=Geminocystis sp. TaxID=2664100 RepID=UPI001E185652|nr:PspA/IM30 family protein [Cyanobacteria bacterium CG_2015-16_32_12]NCO78061.1 PspA/IM30 family protein [Cyanobacteria bacterium CG_2015-22_32_23]NCQ05720.1 PspA/IM30 family protein [Cyanobacteria bacterium CG_2015-09_32_10]NCQ40940.1 PspA/IM30 family protein [Cyanobacteria bacterium CG_2015-04_32_10]NCS83730.1 PspA/IM30 family protein [Cyanobacteria bacterium CG_2015-02_32_10]